MLIIFNSVSFCIGYKKMLCTKLRVSDDIRRKTGKISKDSLYRRWCSNFALTLLTMLPFLDSMEQQHCVEQVSTVQPQCLAARKVNLCVPVFLPITVYRCCWDLKAELLLCSSVKNCKVALSSEAVKQTSTTHQRLLDGTGDDMGMIQTHTNTQTHTHTRTETHIHTCSHTLA